MNCCQQKKVGRVLRIWITKNPKRNNAIIGLHFILLDENVCFSYIQTERDKETDYNLLQVSVIKKVQYIRFWKSTFVTLDGFYCSRRRR